MMNIRTYSTQLASNYRLGQLEGRTYMVAPVVAIVSGVLNGELVPAGEIANGFQSWNGRPVTLDHPNVDGEYVSANHPEIWEQFVVGKLFNVDFVDDRLKGEIWVDVELATKSDDGRLLLAQLKEAKPIEVSTAYFRELDPMAGELGGEPYDGIAVDLKPDHLAILLHGVGACSWADGCGIPRLNREEVRANMPNEEAAEVQTEELEEELEEELTPNEAEEPIEEPDEEPVANEELTPQEDEEPVESLSRFKRLVGQIRDLLSGNEQSMEETMDAVSTAFYRLIDSGVPVGEIAEGYVVRTHPDYILVKRADGVLFQVEYSIADDGSVEFGDVIAGTLEFKPNESESAETDSEGQIDDEEPADDEATEEPAADEDALDEEPESEIAPEPATDEADQEPEAEDEETAEAPATNQSDCQRYVALVEFADSHGGPEWALNRLQEVIATQAANRAARIKRIANAEGCVFNAEDLENLDDVVLEKLELTLVAPKANYSGQPKTGSEVAAEDSATKEPKTYRLPPLAG